MRIVGCNLCHRQIRGHGTTRVLSKIVFHFHALCWTKRDICEALMRNVAGPSPDPIVSEETEARAQAAPAATGALPASLSNWINDDSILVSTVRGKVHAA